VDCLDRRPRPRLSVRSGSKSSSSRVGTKRAHEIDPEAHQMKTLHLVTLIAALGIAAPAVRAQNDAAYSKRSDVTFSAPVHLPGFDLAPGTYRFELAEPVNDRKTVRVSNADGTKVYGMILTVTDETSRTPDEKNPVVMYEGAAPDSPAAVMAWFYPGERIGYEFVYPHDEALKIARASHTRVRAIEGSEKYDRTSFGGAKVGWVDANSDGRDGATATSGTAEPPRGTDKK
jgi:hypothetical protein